MGAPVRAWLDPVVWTEQERTNHWLHECMTDACGDESLAMELLLAGADYRAVQRACTAGATSRQLRAMFA